MKEIVKHILFDTDNINSISSPEGMLLFDIETTGLKKETSQIYLIGCGYFDEPGELTIIQWLTESASDEPIVLARFTQLALSKQTLVHFNGDRFDIPYVSYKLDYYGMDCSFDGMESVDIYKCIKPYKKFFGLERMNQKSVEDFLGIEREDKFNGGQLINYYYEFEMSGDPEAERLILLHNFEDVQGMAKLLEMLNYCSMFEGNFHFVSREYFEKPVKGVHSALVGSAAPPEHAQRPVSFIISYELSLPVPKDVTYEKDGITVFAGEFLLQITVPIYEGEVKVVVKDVENYYYLPQEDMVVHKDVAEFVDKKYRKKATSKNCFLKKQGTFIRTVNMTGDPDYITIPEKGKPVHYIELTGSEPGDPDIYERYAADILKSL